MCGSAVGACANGKTRRMRRVSTPRMRGVVLYRTLIPPTPKTRPEARS
jgi:hypothetical protein